MKYTPQRPAVAAGHVASLAAVLTTYLLVGWAVPEAHPFTAAMFELAGPAVWVVTSPVVVAAIYATGQRVGKYFGVSRRRRQLALGPVTLLLAADAVRNLWILLQVGLPETFNWQFFALVAVATVAVAIAVYTRVPALAVRTFRGLDHDRRVVTATALVAILVVSPVSPFLVQNNLSPTETVSAQDTAIVYDDFEDGDVHDDWNADTSSYWETTTTDPLEGTTSMHFNAGSWNEDIEYNSWSNPDTLSMRFRVDQISSDGNIDIEFSPYGSSGRVGHLAIQDSQFGYYENGNFNGIAPIEANKDYAWGADFTDSSTYDITLYDAETGEQIASESGIPKPNAEDINYLRLGVYTEDYTATFDRLADSVSLQTEADFSGYTKSDDGQTLPNTTIHVNSINYDQLNGTIQEKRDRAEEIQAQIDNVTPSSWASQRDLSPEQILEERNGQRYVLAHSPSDWGIVDPTAVTVPVVGETGLEISNPQVGYGTAYAGTDNPEAGSTVILHIRERKDGVYLQDGVDSAAPGVTTEGTIVVQEIGPGQDGPVVSERTYEADQYLGGLSKDHYFAYANLDRGLYRVYPEDNPEASYILPVGNPGIDIYQYNERLKDVNETLIQQAQDLRDFRGNNTLASQRAVSNETGYWEVTLSNGAVNSTRVVAYNGPDGVTEDPENVTQEDIRQYYEGLNLSQGTVEALQAGSTYLTDGAVTVEAGQQNNLTLQEYSAPQYIGINRSQNLTRRLAEYFFNESFSDLSSTDQLRLENLPRSDLEELYNRTREQVGDSPEVVGQTPDNSDQLPPPSELSTEELRNQIANLSGEISELQDTIESSSNVTERTEQTITAEFIFNRALDSEDVRIDAVYSNGTTQTVSDEYISVDQSTANAVPGVQDQTTVTVDEYPTPSSDVAAISFRATVLDDGEKGTGQATTRNPQFTGTIPQLDNVDFSTLRPGVGEQVTVDVEGSNQFGNLEDVRVYDPTGSQITSTVGGGDATFSPAREGQHTVEVVYSNRGGQNITQRVDIGVLGADVDTPATVRAKTGLTGPYALTGSGLAGGEIQQSGPGRATAIAYVGANDDPPLTVHTHIEELDQSPTADTCTKIARKPDDTSVRQRTSVVTHVGQLDGGAHVYRKVDGELQPIQSDGNQYGSITRAENGTSISTYSAADGEVCVRVVSDPDLGQEINWRVQILQERFPGLPFTDAAGAGLLTALGVSLLFSRRRFET